MHRRPEQLWEFGRQTGHLADSDASVEVRTSLQNVPSCESMKADTVRQGSHLHKDTQQFTTNCLRNFQCWRNSYYFQNYQRGWRQCSLEKDNGGEVPSVAARLYA